MRRNFDVDAQKLRRKLERQGFVGGHTDRKDHVKVPIKSPDEAERSLNVFLMMLPQETHVDEKMLGPDQGDDSPFNPHSITDARERISQTIIQRRGQKDFRDALIEAYGGRCAITGCEVRDVLEAAHIYPYRGPDTNKVSNGLLLRADLHTLFDCNLIYIDPATLTVVVRPKLLLSEYGAYHGQCLRPPNDPPSQAPSREALRLRRVNRT